jgi:hypothetical protein
MSLLNYISKLVRTIGKDDIMEDIRITKKEVSDKLIPLYLDANTYFNTTGIKSQSLKNLNSSFMRVYGKGESHKNMFSAVNAALPKMLANLDILADAIEKSLQTKLITRSASLRQAILIKDVDLASFASNYSFRLLTYAYNEESVAIGESGFDDLTMPKPVRDSVIDNLVTYAQVLKVLGTGSDKFYSKLMALKDVAIDEKTIDALRYMHDDEILEFNTLDPTGFDANPLYHFGIMIAEWQANRYKLNQETKKYLELKLMSMKMQENKSPDPKLELEIEYTARRIEKLEYAIAKAEKSVGGID